MLQPLLDTSPELANTIDEPVEIVGTGFKDRGFSFIPIRPAHVGFIAWVMGRDAPEFDRIFGAAMVDRNFIPVGFALSYFENDGTVSIHAHFGQWLRAYPKDILRHMAKFTATLRDQGNAIIYAIADESIPGSDTLIHWFRGRDTGRRHEFGPIYEIDLRTSKI